MVCSIQKCIAGLKIRGRINDPSRTLSTGQLAEVLPGAVSLFAEAYQRQIGGSLTGSAATKALRAAMKDRKVTGSILTVAGDLAAERAAPSLEPAKRASQAEQARYQNTITDLAVLASNAGVEEGFARIFRTLNAGLGESNNLVEGLAEGFNEATKWADDLLLFPQSFVRALEGKDSLVADWLGYDTTRQLVQDWKDIKEIWSQITAIKAEDIFGDFLPSLQSTSKELAAILNSIAEFKKWKDGTLPTTKIEADQIQRIDPFGTGAYPSPLGIAQAAGNNFLVNLQANRDKAAAIGDPSSIYYNDPAGYDQMQRDRDSYGIDSPKQDLSRYNPQTKQEMEDFSNQQKLASMYDASIVRQSTTNNDIRIELNIDPITLGQMDIQTQADQLANTIALRLQETLVFFPEKE